MFYNRYKRDIVKNDNKDARIKVLLRYLQLSLESRVSAVFSSFVFTQNSATVLHCIEIELKTHPVQVLML